MNLYPLILSTFCILTSNRAFLVAATSSGNVNVNTVQLAVFADLPAYAQYVKTEMLYEWRMNRSCSQPNVRPPLHLGYDCMRLHGKPGDNYCTRRILACHAITRDVALMLDLMRDEYSRLDTPIRIALNTFKIQKISSFSHGTNPRRLLTAPSITMGQYWNNLISGQFNPENQNVHHTMVISGYIFNQSWYGGNEEHKTMCNRNSVSIIKYNSRNLSLAGSDALAHSFGLPQSGSCQQLHSYVNGVRTWSSCARSAFNDVIHEMNCLRAPLTSSERPQQFCSAFFQFSVRQDDNSNVLENSCTPESGVSAKRGTVAFKRLAVNEALLCQCRDRTDGQVGAIVNVGATSLRKVAQNGAQNRDAFYRVTCEQDGTFTISFGDNFNVQQRNVTGLQCTD